MNATWIDPLFSLRFTTALLHFLWQGIAIGAVVVAAGFLLRRAPARLRYVVNVSALLLMAACLPATFALLGAPDVPPSIGSELRAASAPADTTPMANDEVQRPFDAGGVDRPAEPPLMQSAIDTIAIEPPSAPNPIAASFAPFAPWLTAVYFIGVGLMLIRMASGLRGGHRLRQTAIPIDDAPLLATIRRQARRIGLRFTPAAAWCEQISIPVVIGVIRPLVLLPPALASGLSPDQVQALITHELAHIRRLDLLVNLLQRLIEAVLFFHPVVWLVSRRINVERENATDDMVLAAGWRAPQYADALLRMAELSSSLRTARFAPQAATLAASGQGASDFKRRVLRLLDTPETTKLHLTRGGMATLFVLVLLSLSAPIAMHALADSPESDQTTDRSDPGTPASDETLSAATGDDSQLIRLAEQAAFGEEKHGVQMGIAPSSQRRPYSMEDRVPLTLIFRNVRSEPVTFKSHLDFLVAVPDVTYEDGGSIPVTMFMHWMFIPPTTITLGPGEVWGIETPGLGFQGQGAWSLTDPPAGRYRLTFSAGIHSEELVPREPDPQVSLPEPTNSVLTPTWSEHLTTGELSFEIAQAEDGALRVTLAENGPPQRNESQDVTQANDAPASEPFDKTQLPRVADTYHHATTVLGDFVSGGGIIERVDGDTIHFASGDHVVVPRNTPVVVPENFNPRIRVLETESLEPGMAVAWWMRRGTIQSLVLTGIVETPPADDSVFETIRELGLRRGNEVNDSLDGQFPIRVTGKEGPVLIAIGQTKLIELPERTMLVEWQIADYRPEGVEDVEPFDYLLVQWRESGRITWTCYQSPEVAMPDPPADDPVDDQNETPATPPPGESRDEMEEVRREFMSIKALEDSADAESAGSEEWVEILRQAAGEYEVFHNRYRSQFIGLAALSSRARCLAKLGDIEEAESIYEEIRRQTGNFARNRSLQDQERADAETDAAEADPTETETASERAALDRLRALGATVATATSVDLSDVVVTDDDLSVLAHLPRLKTLVLMDEPVTDDGRVLKPMLTDAGLRHLSGLENLESLDANALPITDSGLRALAGLTGLRRLSLRSTRITDAGLPQLSSFRQLESLELRGTEITDETMRQLAELPHLSYLDVASTTVSDEGLAHLPRFQSLSSLRIGGPDISNAGMAHVLEVPNLSELALYGTQVTDEGIERLPELELTHLVLQGVGITDVGLESVSSCDKLQLLGLVLTDVSDAGIRRLHGLENLERAFLTFRGPSREAISELQKTLPQARIRLVE